MILEGEVTILSELSSVYSRIVNAHLEVGSELKKESDETASLILSKINKLVKRIK